MLLAWGAFCCPRFPAQPFNKMKQIRKIEEMLDETVTETIARMGLVTGKTVSLEKYKECVDGLRFQLVENWCLCRYCELYDKANVRFGHWISENLKGLEIKEGVGKGETLSGMLISDYDYNDSEMIKRITAGKFKREKITGLREIESVCVDFADGI